MNDTQDAQKQVVSHEDIMADVQAHINDAAVRHARRKVRMYAGNSANRAYKARTASRKRKRRAVRKARKVSRSRL